MKNEPKSLAEWLESQGNPKHAIADGEDGTKVIVVDDDDSLGNKITIYSFKEKNYGDYKSFWMSSGWCINKEWIPALKKYLAMEETSPEPELLQFEVWEWYVNEAEDSECERRIDIIKAVSEWHAKAQLKSGIKSGKYHEGMWLEYNLDGKKIELDVNGRVEMAVKK